MSTPSKSVSYSTKDDNNKLRRGPWTFEEDDLLIKHIANHGEGRWNLLAMSSGLRRTGKSCRLRWLNYLKPDIKRGNLTSEEQLLIFELHSKWGNRWSKIAQHLPGRTDNEIKNYWRTRIQKQAQARHLKIDTAIHLPLDGVSHYSTIGRIPTQVSYQDDCMNEGVLNCLDQCQKNSDYEHNNGFCMSSSESANISNMTQPLEYTTSQFEALDNSEVSYQDDCMNEGVLNCLDQCQKNSDYEHNNGFCMSSSESANISNMTQPLEYTTSQFEALDNSEVSYQDDCMNEGGVLNCLDQCEKNSDSEHNNGLCMSSSESANFSNMTQLLEYTTSQFEALDNSEFGICAYEGYHINNTALNLTTTMVGEGLEYQTRDCQISQSNWLDEEFVGSTSWNMNELWQVRNIQK